MHRNRIARAPGFSYVGQHRYFVTCCTFGRLPFFRDELIVAATYLQLRRTVDGLRFVLLAYVFMPDHLHLLLEGYDEASDLCRCVKHFKQMSGHQFARQRRRTLWQPRYFDHVLRDGESTVKMARYIFENPVRKGLVRSPSDYPYLGSDVGRVEEFFRVDRIEDL